MIPLCDLQQQYSVLKEEIDEVMQQVAAEANYILGSNVRAFEQEMAAYCGCRHAIGVGSGTDALHLSLRALNIGPGDEVITTPFTFIGTTEAICMVGAKPVFVDIDSRTYNVDVSLLEAAITDRTKAILPVHLYGQPCDMGRIVQVAETYELAIVEDCASGRCDLSRQASGNLWKSRLLELFPSKNLGCFGDGGMVLTNDSQVFERVEMLRRHGGKVKYHHSEIGLNSRLDELQAAILRVKLRYLDGWNRSRREHAYRYNRFLESVPEIQRPGEFGVRDSAVPTCTSEANEGIEAVYHQYTVSVADRETIQSGLGDAGIASAIYYPVPLHLQEVHRDLGLAVGTFPVAESASKHCLSLPMFPELTEEQAFSVAERLRRLTALECQAA